MIRKAAASDIDAVEKIYDELHQAEEEGTTTIGWLRGIYPVRATAEAALDRGDLFRIQVDVYAGAPWEHEVPEDQVCVLHTLVISPRAKRRGFGRKFAGFYEAYAAETGCTELRIDTNERNLPARAMYKSIGYREIDVVPTVFNGIPGVNLVLLEKWIG